MKTAITTPPAAESALTAHSPVIVRKYAIRPYFKYLNYSTGEQEREPSGWDVWEFNGRTEVVCDPCDSREEAESVLENYGKLYGAEAIST